MSSPHSDGPKLPPKKTVVKQHGDMVFEIAAEVQNDMESRWRERGYKVDVDFYDDLNDVISDYLEDKGTSFFTGLQDNNERHRILDALMEELD